MIKVGVEHWMGIGWHRALLSPTKLRILHIGTKSHVADRLWVTRSKVEREKAQIVS